MAEVKWIKITTDIFDDEKVLLIESLPESDSIIVIWFKLLCLAGKMNNSGVFMLNDSIAYTDQMLATIFRRKEATVRMALDVFENFGMIDRIDEVITIPNWGKHQTLDKIEERREYAKEYMRKYRKKQKLLANCNDNRNVNSSDNSSVYVNPLEVEEEREGDKEGEGDVREKVNYQQIADMYNDTCVSYPRITKLSDARKRAIKARLKTYTVDDFNRMFELAEQSNFLKGANNRNWHATFDWMICDSNMAKILDGNYENKADMSKDRTAIDWSNV